MDYNRKLGRIEQPESYNQEYDRAYAKEDYQRPSTATASVPVRSLLSSQESTFKSLDELHDIISTLESRLYHLLYPEEALKESVATEKTGPMSTAVAMAKQINESIIHCNYRLRNLIDRIET
jgi:hypothetical protein